MSVVSIKGSKEGLTAYINSDDYDKVKNEFVSKINEGKEFFTGCNLKLIGYKNLSVDEYDKLSKFLKDTFSINALYKITNENFEKKETSFNGIAEGKTKFIKRTVRSGQKIIYNGNIVIIGDVNSGAEVIAMGNIIVLGVLRGIAHAGYGGNMKAIVAAYMLEPSQLRIASLIARGPDDRAFKPQSPEVALIYENSITVEPYVPNKYY